MILRVQHAKLAGPHHLWLEFNDGARGLVELSSLLEGPIFEMLKDSAFFAKFELDPVCGTVAWPNGADFAPEALHALLPLITAVA